MKSKKSSIGPRKSPQTPQPEPDVCLQVAEDLQHLRALAREVHQHALARLEAEIVHVLRCVAPEKGVAPEPASQRDLKLIARRVEEFDINPHKGRCKDLRRLNKLVGHLTEIVDQW